LSECPDDGYEENETELGNDTEVNEELETLEMDDIPTESIKTKPDVEKKAGKLVTARTDIQSEQLVPKAKKRKAPRQCAETSKKV
jgi:hypothetical protein